MPPRATLLGVPWDRSSSFQRGAAAAPDAIRAALWSASSNTWNTRGDDLGRPTCWTMPATSTLPEDAAAARDAITARILRLSERRQPPPGARRRSLHHLSDPRALAGRGLAADDPALRRARRHVRRFEGDRYSHACPFARVMEEGWRRGSSRSACGRMTATCGHRRRASAPRSIRPGRWRDAPGRCLRRRGPALRLARHRRAGANAGPGHLASRAGRADPARAARGPRRRARPGRRRRHRRVQPRNDFRDLTAYVAATFVKELVGVFR